MSQWEALNGSKGAGNATASRKAFRDLLFYWILPAHGIRGNKRMRSRLGLAEGAGEGGPT
jgi:hypothetical protein